MYELLISSLLPVRLVQVFQHEAQLEPYSDVVQDLFHCYQHEAKFWKSRIIRGREMRQNESSMGGLTLSK